jgi:FixJ family two-component response regulator
MTPFVKGNTSKEDGNGLGLSSAKIEIEKVNGSISLSNDSGAVVKIKLGLASIPSYYLKSINLYGIEKIIILDDDQNIHNVWIQRFKDKNIELEHYYSGEILLKHYNTVPKNNLLLSDYELLGENINGIDCIEKLKASHNSILISARSEEVKIIERASKMSLKILPKSMALNVPVTNKVVSSNIILIDDDKLVHMNWKRTLRKKGYELSSFYSVDDFLDNSKSFERKTPIYVDSNLGEGLKGEILSEDIYNEGFKNLYITTGYHSDSINKPLWIKDIIGKAPQFI